MKHVKQSLASLILTQQQAFLYSETNKHVVNRLHEDVSSHPEPVLRGREQQFVSVRQPRDTHFRMSREVTFQLLMVNL